MRPRLTDDRKSREERKSLPHARLLARLSLSVNRRKFTPDRWVFVHGKFRTGEIRPEIARRFPALRLQRCRSMPGRTSIIAWSHDDRECLLFETPAGWRVHMTLAGLSSLEQACTSLTHGLRIAAAWRRRCDESTAIDPKAA